MNAPLVLATIDSAHDDERLQLVLTREADGSSVISLQQQSWGEGIGWFTQSAVEMQPEQVAALRMSLGNNGLCCKPARPLGAASHRSSEEETPATLPFARIA